VFPGAAPVATQLSTTTAQVTFQAAVGGGASITYTCKSAVSPYTLPFSTSATISAVQLNQPTPGDVTLQLSGFTTGTSHEVQVIATGANTLVGTSAASNTFTQD
jgi:hypothetical protein